MVLLPGCACCVGPCGDLAGRLVQTNSIQITIFGTDFERRAICSIKDLQGLASICGGYVVGSQGSAVDVFKGSLYTGTYQLTLYGNTGYTDGFFNYRTRAYRYLSSSIPYQCSVSFDFQALIKHPVGTSLTAYNGTLVQTRVAVLASKNTSYTRAGAFAPYPSSCQYQTQSSCAFLNTDPTPSWNQQTNEGGEWVFPCAPSFSFASMSGSVTVSAINFLSLSNTPFGKYPDEKNNQFATWDSQSGTSSATIGFSDVVVP